jgi:2',3'-cyclic-nucleotide 2'-phosphodiesterase (5'-nucleotidase family)
MRGERVLFCKFLLSCFALFVLAAGGLTGRTGFAQETPKETFEERLGDDDGAALAILFIANMRGNLGLCDCNHPRGGLARRVGYLEGFKKKFPETPVIQVEAGSFWYTPSQDRLVILRNQQVTEAFSRFPVDVINLSRSDAIQARKLLVRDGLAERTAKLPMINNIISANAVFGTEVAAPQPYLIKEVAGPRIKSKNLRIGFVGLGTPIKGEPGMRDATMRNPFDTVHEIVVRARKDCDILVIVAHCELDPAIRLAKENPEADIVIAGNAEGLLKPRLVDKTLVVSAAPGNIQQGDLRVYIEKDGRFRFKVLSTDLDELVPSNPAALEFSDNARRDQERLKYGP